MAAGSPSPRVGAGVNRSRSDSVPGTRWSTKSTAFIPAPAPYPRAWPPRRRAHPGPGRRRPAGCGGWSRPPWRPTTCARCGCGGCRAAGTPPSGCRPTTAPGSRCGCTARAAPDEAAGALGAGLAGGARGGHRPASSPRPHPTRDGDLLVVVDDPAVVDDGPRVCDLLRWVDGHFVDVRLTPAHLRTMGTLMADLEEHGRRFVRPDGFVRPDVTGWTDLAAARRRPARRRGARPGGRRARRARARLGPRRRPGHGGTGQGGARRRRGGRAGRAAARRPAPRERPVRLPLAGSRRDASRPASSTSTTAATARTPTTRR